MNNSFPSYNFHGKLSSVKNPQHFFEGYGSYGAVNISQNDNQATAEITSQLLSCDFKITACTPVIPLYVKSHYSTARYTYKDRVYHPVREAKSNQKYARKVIKEFRNTATASGGKFRPVLTDLYEQVNSPSDDPVIPSALRPLVNVYKDVHSLDYTPLYNSDFACGSVKCLQWRDFVVLLNVSPRSTKCTEKVNLLQLEMDTETGVVSSTYLTSFIAVDTVYGLDACCFGDTLWLGALTEDCTIIWSYDLQSRRTKRLIHTPARPTAVTFSPFIEGEAVIADQGGNYLLVSPSESPVSIADRVTTRFVCHEHWRSGHFGAHPRSVVLADQSCVIVRDIRTTSRETFDLFALPNSCLYKTERIVNCMPHPTNHFTHLITTDYNLLLVDERFPGKPALSWQHALIHPPPYASITSGVASNDIIVLASQNPPEACCFPLMPATARDPYRSSGQPWKLSNIGDFTKAPEIRDDAHCRMVRKRFDTSLVGVSVMSCDRDSFVVFQMDSHGDVFYQTFSTGHSPVTSPHPFPATAVTSCREWVNSLKMDPRARKPIRKRYINRTKKKRFSLKALQTPNPNHRDCRLCQPQFGAHSTQASQSRLDTSGDVCERCGLQVQSAASLAHSTQQDTVPGPLQGYTDNLDLDKRLPLTAHLMDLKDTDGQIVQSLWHGDDRLEDLIKERDEENKKKRKEFLRRCKISDKPTAVDISQMENSTASHPDSLIASLTAKLIKYEDNPSQIDDVDAAGVSSGSGSLFESNSEEEVLYDDHGKDYLDVNYERESPTFGDEMVLSPIQTPTQDRGRLTDYMGTEFNEADLVISPSVEKEIRSEESLYEQSETLERTAVIGRPRQINTHHSLNATITPSFTGLSLVEGQVDERGLSVEDVSRVQDVSRGQDESRDQDESRVQDVSRVQNAEHDLLSRHDEGMERFLFSSFSRKTSLPPLTTPGKAKKSRHKYVMGF